MDLTKKISLLGVAMGLSLAVMMVSNVASAQTETAPGDTNVVPTESDIPPELMPLSRDLDCQTSAECAEKFDADIEEGIALAEKYDIYTPEQEKIATTFKTEVLERLRTVSQDKFDEEILALANKILSEKPSLARTIGLTQQTVNAAETIISTVRDAGVNIRICQKSPENLSREQLIACVKAGNDLSSKEKLAGDYIPRENAKAGEAQRMLDLESSLLAGEYSGLGKIGVEQAGRICLKPGSESITDCDRIAEKFFGAEGVEHLREVRKQATSVKEYYTKETEKMDLVTPDGQRLIGKGAIKNACDRAFEENNLGLARACGNFAVKNGYATQEEIENGLKLLTTFSQKAGGVSFDDCRFNPESCREFLPDEFRSQFDSHSEIFKAMSESIGFDPARCENTYDSDIGRQCFEGAKKALVRVEEIAKNSPEARRVVNEIRSRINEGERMTSKLNEFNQDSRSGRTAGPGGCKGPEECFKYCSQPANSAECISFGAKNQIFDRDTVVERFNVVNERLNVPYQPYQPYRPDQEFRQYPLPYPYQPQQPVGPSPECFAAISSGDFARAKTVCSNVTDNYERRYPEPITQPFPVCPFTVMPSPCPEGQVRQQTSDGRGCPAYGACITADIYRPIDNPRCPMMPTVNSCPAGQEKYETYRSNECGAYYACRDANSRTSCPTGQYWYTPPGGGTGYCMPTSPTNCTYGQYWDPAKQSCQPSTQTYKQCDWSIDYLKMSTNTCVARSTCYVTSNPDYNSQECQGVRGATQPVSGSCGSLTTQTSCQASPGCGWANGACGGNVTTNTSCPSGQYWNGTVCVNSTTTGQCPSGQSWYTPPGGGYGYCRDSSPSSISGCFYPNATKDGKSLGWTVWCEADYYNCHLGDSSGNTVTSSGLSLGAPSWCAKNEMITTSTTTSPSGTCPSGQYWSGTACMNSPTMGQCPTGYHSHSESGGFCMNDQENYSGTCYNLSGTTTITCPQQTYVPPGGYGCGTYVTQSSCTASSGCSWQNNACSSSGMYATSCPSGQYWSGTACVNSTTTGQCPTGQYWYTPPGGGTGYCMSSSGTSCPSGQYWSGTACVTTSTTNYSTDPATGCTQAGGTWNSSTSYCQMPTNTTSCPSDQYWNGTACQSNTMPSSGTTGTSCPSDQYWNGTACQSNTSSGTTGTTCPSGQYWSGTACVNSTSGDTSGTYTAPSSGTYTPPPSGTTDSSSGSYTPPPSSPSTMILCSQSGGSWTGVACNLAENISDQKAYYSYYQRQSTPFLAQVFGAFTDLFR